MANVTRILGAVACTAALGIGLGTNPALAYDDYRAINATLNQDGKCVFTWSAADEARDRALVTEIVRDANEDLQDFQRENNYPAAEFDKWRAAPLADAAADAAFTAGIKAQRPNFTDEQIKEILTVANFAKKLSGLSNLEELRTIPSIAGGATLLDAVKDQTPASVKGAYDAAAAPLAQQRQLVESKDDDDNNDYIGYAHELFDFRVDIHEDARDPLIPAVNQCAGLKPGQQPPGQQPPSQQPSTTSSPSSQKPTTSQSPSSQKPTTSTSSSKTSTPKIPGSNDDSSSSSEKGGLLEMLSKLFKALSGIFNAIPGLKDLFD